LSASGGDAQKAIPETPPRQGAEAWNSLAVQVSGRDGTMVLKPGDEATRATVQFADGSREAVALGKIRLKTWMAL
jgi:hypothetical protein